MSDTENLSLQDATDLVEAAFRAASVPSVVARSVAVALVTAEAEGQVGHGFSRVEDYIVQVRSGKIAADAEVSTYLAGTTSLLVDAGHGFAYPALDRAIEEGGQLALKHGCAMMGIYRSHHCGALSIQVERLARQGLLAIMVANAPASMAPWGGSKPIFGTNPIAFAAPRGEQDPLVIDLSLSKVARGKIMNAKKTGKPIPEGWALDRSGEPTTDPVAALDGTMVPIGEAKGTALALMVEILSTVMVGAARSTEASSFFSADGQPPAVGQFIIAMKPMDQTGFESRLREMLNDIASMEGARIPGTRRVADRQQAERDGLNVPTHYIRAIRQLISAVR